MPVLDPSELNVTIAILGAFILLFGAISVKLKKQWYLGDALPAVLLGIVLGPLSAKLIDANQWGAGGAKNQVADITFGVCRVVIGVQLVMAGFQLPRRYPWHRWKELLLLLLPGMATMWLCTTGCIILMIPKLTTLSAMVIASLVTSSDPVLSQALAKGPFADKYVPRALREIISAEAGCNDGFGLPFLFLATFFIRHADNVVFKTGSSDNKAALLMARAGPVGRLGGGPGKAMELWLLETWLYFFLVGAAVGIVLGVASLYTVKFTLRRKWIDSEFLLLFPTALGLFIIGTTGAAGLDDLLACFCAGVALNWDGEYLNETLKRLDEVNSSIDVLLNFGGFILIGTIIPWDQFNSSVTGITPARLMALGVLVLIARRIPAILCLYKLMPSVITSWREALFMGYFGPIGIGAVFYVEHAKHLFPYLEDAKTIEEENLIRAMVPVVYFLVLFSIVVHTLSIPVLDCIYRWRNIPTITEENPVEIHHLASTEALPNNAYVDPKRKTIVVHNRFSRAPEPVDPEVLNQRLEVFAQTVRQHNEWAAAQYNISQYSGSTKRSSTDSQDSVASQKQAAKEQFEYEQEKAHETRTDSEKRATVRWAELPPV
ncbi:Na(+)/H(+) antiporter 1 [Polyplosphaeria fusca]|uniref:Na(+)/H(+) antiporter 1 n=1 Tax=Polyplosphaeria fusca TaxID=682080 RepID=A0A9P4V8M9_9PLEO|nr:Na(+)/H(+) antiporter 1 [Polyplosphaeria fusca]